MAYVLWAPPALVALAFAGLLIAAGPRTRREWILAAVLLPLGLAWLLIPSPLALDQLLKAWVLIGSVAFVWAALELEGPFLRRAAAAVAAAGLAVVVLAWITGVTWHRLHWEAGHAAQQGLALVAAGQPEVADVLRPAVHFVSDVFPATFVLQALVGWALAWQWHCHIATSPLGAPVARLRDFSFNDHWVWGVIAGLALLVTGLPRALTTVAANLLTVLGGLYALRGLGVVVALATAAGLSPGALVAGGIVAAVLVIPLLLFLPALWTVGIFDTWFQFRRRSHGSHPA